MYPVANIATVVLAVALLLDVLLLFQPFAKRTGSSALEIRRDLPRRFSNGDENPVTTHFVSRYAIPVTVRVLDDLPYQFQARDFGRDVRIPAHGTASDSVQLRPVSRGVYEFGDVNAFVESGIGLAQRRFRNAADPRSDNVAVYPSFVQMRQYALMAISDRLAEVGVKPVRRLGHTMEFDQIRAYVRGDDVRTLNWKASARSRRLMVNQFQDERSQQVVSLIDMGRAMKMPFDGLSLLDYAINACLAVSNVSIIKEDKAGLFAFSNDVQAIVKPARSNDQMQRILERLYRLTTDFSEPNFEKLASVVLRTLSQRSLLMLYTNFESLSGLRRQLPYLRALSRRHLVVAVLFENTSLRELLVAPQDTLEGTYVKLSAEQFAREKREVVRELKRYGIHSILTPPAELTVNAINAYLQLKASRRI